MKLYIAISSLNLDNIVSSESISPSWYYKERLFGGKYFEPINGLNMTEKLILFSVKPKFTINDSERDQSPIVLEIEDEEQFGVGKLNKIFDEDFAIYTYDRTIILTPWNSRLLFFDRESLYVFDNQSQGSRNDKLGSKFPKIIDSTGTDLSYLISKIANDKVGHRTNFDDTPFNVAKGCLWGYILGNKMSISPDIAQLLSIKNSIHNIVSNAISNNGECKHQFYYELCSLDEKYRNIADKEINELWLKEIPQNEIQILKKRDVYDEAQKKFYTQNGYKPLRNIPIQKTNKEDWIEYRQTLENYTKNKIKDNRTNKNGTLSERFVWENRILRINDFLIVNKVLSLILSNKMSKESIRTDRLETAKTVEKEILQLVKDKAGKDNWNNTQESHYLNSLYYNLRDYQPFDFNYVEDLELKSIAAILQKGDDYDALVRYLQDNKMTDYTLIMCLWGALEGYANISKAVLNGLLTPKNVSEINNILLGMSKHDLFPKFTTPAYQPKAEDENQQQKNPMLQKASGIPDWMNWVKEICGKLTNQQKEGVSKAIIENGKNANTRIFVDILKKQKGWKKSKYIKKLSNTIDTIENQIRTVKQIIIQPDLFSQKSTKKTSLDEKSIIYDPKAVEHIKECQNILKENTDKVRDLFINFQAKYQNGYYYLHQDTYNRNNEDVINHFCKWCLSNKNKDKIPWSSEVSNAINNFKNYLMKIYSNN